MKILKKLLKRNCVYVNNMYRHNWTPRGNICSTHTVSYTDIHPHVETHCSSSEIFAAVKVYCLQSIYPYKPSLSGERVCVCVCVCEWEKDRERERDEFNILQSPSTLTNYFHTLCVRACVRARVCVCVCARTSEAKTGASGHFLWDCLFCFVWASIFQVVYCDQRGGVNRGHYRI